MSIYDNVAFGLRLNRYKGKLNERVEHGLRRAALWDEVKDKQKGERSVAVGRSAAALVHRTGDCHRAYGVADGRALLGAGPTIFIAELSNWDFSFQVSDSDFAFQPLAGVTQVELKPSPAPTTPQ
jgi:hypothetical protein